MDDDIKKSDIVICAKYRNINKDGYCMGVSLNWIGTCQMCKECHEYFENLNK